uniref:Uncharacterized protein n=1 Tax=Anguilla anguilla TaxID=7936 RepID=A0A0E9TBZ9_ANGAN
MSAFDDTCNKSLCAIYDQRLQIL